MTLQQLMEKLGEILPGSSVDTDNEGQLVIYTNKYEPYGGADLAEFAPVMSIEEAVTCIICGVAFCDKH